MVNISVMQEGKEVICTLDYKVGSPKREDLPMVQSKESENNNHVFFQVTGG